ncbi:MAG TPA: RNA methyltransferase [Burkholderiales bacterium]|nr:RNA methyltransferase [Burkholderiales bacterium]
MTADVLKNVRVVLCGTAHPGNIGAAARAMKTMGLARLCLVAPKRFPDPQAEWLATGATDVLESARVCAGLEEALSGSAFTVACTARVREIAAPMVTAREAAARIVEVARAQDAALVFGNESFGLTTEEVNKCQLLATIPANPRYSSLNLAAAVQVFAYELWLAATGGRAPAAPARELATFEEIEGLYRQLERAARESGFFDPRKSAKLMPKLRRLFGRARLEKEEVNILRGLLSALANPKPSRPPQQGGPGSP